MRSKTSYFNPTLFKKNLTRFWPLWGGASALGALAPLYMLVAYLNRGMGSFIGKGLEMTRIYYSVLQYGVPIASLFYAALCALAVWHYLYNARSLGMYHALPITRKGLFTTNFLSGMAMMLIPYAVTGGLAILVTLFIGLFEPVGVLVTILGVLGESFFYFAAATCVVFVTGNPFAFAAFYFIFHFLAVGIEYLGRWLMYLFYFGVPFRYEGAAAFLSPTYFLVEKLGVDVSWREVVTAEGWRSTELETVTLIRGWVIAVYALVGVVFLGCAWLLYQRRRSESAGDVVAVGWMKPVFRYGVALCAALAGGVLLYLIFCKDFINRETARPVPMAVCMAIAGIVGYYIASMLLAKSLAVFRRSGKGVLATVAAAIAVCVLIAADPFGVERWVPEAAEAETVGFSLYGGMGGYLDVRLSDPDSIQKVLDLHRTVLTERNFLDDWSRNTELWEDGNGWLELSYYQVNGKRVRREYSIPVSEAALERLETVQKAAALASDPVVQEANIFESVASERAVSARIIGGFVGYIYDTADEEANSMDLTAEQARMLEDAIRRDVQAGHFGKTMFVPDYKERDQVNYAGSIQLHYNVTRPPEYSYYGTSETVYLHISVYCTETVKALEDVGVLDGTHKLLTEAENDAILRGGDSSYAYYDYPGTGAVY